MFIHKCILKGEEFEAARDPGSTTLSFRFLNIVGFYLDIEGASEEEVDAMAAAINAPIERMRLEMQREEKRETAK